MTTFTFWKASNTWRQHPSFLLSLFFFFVFAGCDPKPKPAPEPAVPQIKETKTGLASFYSRSLDGEKTAGGETFDNKEMVAAHPTYPLGTIVRVTNLEKGGVVEVRISDRGPTRQNQKEGVIIDLSRAAAKQLGMVKDGSVQVQVDVLEWGADERK